MKLKTWKEYAAFTKDEIKSALAPLRAVRERKKGELAIAQLEEKIATKEQAIEEMCTKDNIDFDALIDAQDELALTERKVGQFKEILEQLFPATTA